MYYFSLLFQRIVIQVIKDIANEDLNKYLNSQKLVFWKCVGEGRRIDTFSLGLKLHSNHKVLTTLALQGIFGLALVNGLLLSFLLAKIMIFIDMCNTMFNSNSSLVATNFLLRG